MFDFSLVGREKNSMAEIIHRTVMKCDLDTRKDLVNNICIVGVGSMIEGLKERLNKELVNLFPSTLKVKVIAPLERRYSVWIGGSILSSFSTFQQYWVSKEDYDESGLSYAKNPYRRSF